MRFAEGYFGNRLVPEPFSVACPLNPSAHTSAGVPRLSLLGTVGRPTDEAASGRDVGAVGM